MKLGIHGSRTLTDERVRILLLEEIDRHQPATIVTHGEPEGVCGLARALCREMAIPLTLHFLNFQKRRGAFEWRSKAVLADSDHGIFIHDGRSKGTSNELVLAQKMGLPHTLHVLELTRFKASVGFEIDREWEAESMLIDNEPLPARINQA